MKSSRLNGTVFTETQENVMAPQARTIPSSSRCEEPQDKNLPNLPAVSTASEFRAEEDAEPSIEILPEAKPSHAGPSKVLAESSLTKALDRLDNETVARYEEEEEAEEEELVVDEWEENNPNTSRNEAPDEELEIISPPSLEKSPNRAYTCSVFHLSNMMLVLNSNDL